MYWLQSMRNPASLFRVPSNLFGFSSDHGFPLSGGVWVAGCVIVVIGSVKLGMFGVFEAFEGGLIVLRSIGDRVLSSS